MHAPVQVTPPAIPPVTWEEADAHLRLDGDLNQRPLVESLITAATAHLDGWNGMLGRALVTQTWRQDFDSFDTTLDLPLRPVQSINTVKWQSSLDGTWATIAATNYALKKDASGRAYVRFENGYGFPSPLYEVGAVQVEYVAGEAQVPEDIKRAILMLVGHWYEYREAVVIGTVTASVPMAVDALLSKHRPVRV